MADRRFQPGGGLSAERPPGGGQEPVRDGIGVASTVLNPRARPAPLLPGPPPRHIAPRRPPQEGGGYSRFVRLMKVVLPLAAVALVGLLAAWPSIREAEVSGRVIDRGQTEVVNARFFGRDEKNRPYSVTATQALQVDGNADLINLTRPTTEFTQANGSWVTMRADRGRYRQESGRLVLMDNVHVLRDDGMEFTTRSAEVDTKAGTAWGDERTVGQGPSGEILAEGFRIYDGGETVTFINGSSATLGAQKREGARK